MTRIAVIGAGLSGLVFASTLANRAQVCLFEKSRGFGGRMATRRRDGCQFDHGAQFFTARSESFRAFLEPWLAAGVVGRWDARFVEFEDGQISSRRTWDADYPHYVGVPGMNALGRALGELLDVATDTRVAAIRGEPGAWLLSDDAERELGRFDWVVSAIPAAQADVLLPSRFEHRAEVARRDMPGCYSLMLDFTRPLSLDWDAALVKHPVISWISVDSSKPGRPEGYRLLVHASNRWAEDNMELADEAVIAALVEATATTTGQDVSAAGRIELQRWRYANPGPRDGESALIDASNRLAAIGDWCIRGRIEAAYQSGRDAAEKIASLL